MNSPSACVRSGPRTSRRLACLLVALLSAGTLVAADFEVGVARVKITPPTPFWLTGYASRTRPAETVLQDLWAKALAFRDPDGHRFVMVTMDLIGLPREVAAAVASRAKEQYQLERADLMLNCSHTHCGPKVGDNLGVMFDLSAADNQRVQEYAEALTGKLVAVIGDALQGLAPAVVASGKGSTGFAINRRQAAAKGVQLGVNAAGPVDHTVPVLRVTSPQGELRAVLFGYACHNTTLGGDFYEINGDYAGHAQAEFEQAHPGTTALFLMLCGGDQNPNPRGTVDHARKYGHELAAEVERVLGTGLAPVRAPIRTAWEETRLEFAPHTRETFEKELTDPNKFNQRRARLMLGAYDRGAPVRDQLYPVQAVRFNQDVTLLALGGEVVVDYNLRARREFAGENLIVAGYSNEVMCYIPSKRVLAEGGYEPVTSMIYYGKPGPFTDQVEEQVFASVRRALERVGAKPAPPDPDPAPGARIDTHIHLYDPSRSEGVPWPPKDNPVLYRTHLLPEFHAVARPNGISHAIIVEASEWDSDNTWVLDLAEKSPELLGVIGNLDPRGANFGVQLEGLCARKEFLGLRLRRTERVNLLEPGVEAKYAQLARHHRVLELLVPMVPAADAAAFARRHPDLRIIIDHVAGAKLRDGKIEPEWEAGVRELAACPSVCCKISGFYPAAAPNGQPAPLDLATYRPIFELLWQAFGRERLFWGSNWPVSDMGGPYGPTVRLVEDFWREKGGEGAVRDVFCRNALRIYGIDPSAVAAGKP